MPNDPSIFYVSVADYRARTNQSAHVTTLTDSQVKSLILDSMVMIDGQIGLGWVPFDEDQEFIFPRLSDTDSSGAFVPRAITSATVLLADSLLVRRAKGFNPEDILSETDQGYSYTKKERQSNSVLPEEVEALIQPFVIGLGGVLGV